MLKMNEGYIKVAIKRTPHFGVRSAPALNFGGVRMPAPALHIYLQKPIFL